MVRWPREYGMWLLVGVLTVLLGLLAMLQYRWTGEIGRAEAARQQHRLERSARRFAQELRQEVSQVGIAFRPDFRGRSGDVRTDKLDHLARWEQTRHAELVSRMVVVTRPPSGELLVEAADLGGDTLVPIPLPAGLERVRQQLEDAGPSPSTRGFRWDWMLPRPLAVVVPIVRPHRRERGRFRPEDLRLSGATVLELNLDYLTSELLPQLAEVHFGPLDEGDYAVAVLRREDGAIVYSSDPTLRPDELEQGDVRMGLLSHQGWSFGPGSPGRYERGPRRAGGPLSPGGPPPRGLPDRKGEPGERGRPSGGEGDSSPWILVVRHHGGSLAEAVEGVRRRNLGVGLGILLLLGTAAVVLAVGAQRARRLARQQLEFVAGVTHEINTPLAAIRSAGQNLADGVVSDTQQVRRYGDLIQKEGGRLTALVAQVLDFAGIESGSRAYAADPVGLGPLVHKVVGDLSLVLEQAGMTVEIHVAEDLPEIRGDESALRRALENLITNAAKFGRKGGWIGIRASAASDHRTVALRVEDRGPGIPKSERGQVFEPFYRGRGAQQTQAPGSGLGLSFVRHVVEAHGGRVHVEPRDDGGTAMVMELPIGKQTSKESA